MNDDITPIERDPELARRLAALSATPTAADVAALRTRILAAAAPRLQVRAGILPFRRASWLDVTSSIGRIAIPLAVAAAITAMLVLRALPQITTVDDSNTMAMATPSGAIAGDSLLSPQSAEELLLPQDADAVLLAPFDHEARQ